MKLYITSIVTIETDTAARSLLEEALLTQTARRDEAAGNVSEIEDAIDRRFGEDEDDDE